MTTKIQRVRRIAGIAIGAVKAIFRTGRVWGTTRARVSTARRSESAVPARTAFAAGAVGGAVGAYFLDPKSGQGRRRAIGKRVPGVNRAVAVARRSASKDEEERVDPEAVQMAAGNGAGAPVPAKEPVTADA
jgi:hypothetical protein